MSATRRPISTVLVILGVLGMIGCLWWPFSPREFRGKLVLAPDGMIYIPERPPPWARLVTANGTYVLAFGRSVSSPPSHRLRRELSEMDGKEVVVRGTLNLPRPLFKRPTTIAVQDIRLSTPSATTTSAAALTEGPDE
jgi:hypothetical protein